jgi:hypothetical protein
MGAHAVPCGALSVSSNSISLGLGSRGLLCFAPCAQVGKAYTDGRCRPVTTDLVPIPVAALRSAGALPTCLIDVLSAATASF